MSNGHLKITDEKVVFNHTKSGRKDTIKGSDIELVNWQRLAGVWGIRMFTKDGALHRFAGFKEPERERIAKHFNDNFKLDMLDRFERRLLLKVILLSYVLIGSCL